MQNSANAIAAISNKRAENSMGKNNKVNAERKSKVDDNTAKMQSIKWLGV